MKSASPIIAITLLLLLPASAAFAQKGENSWLNSSGGDFDVPSNWSQNVVPGSFEAAVFDLGATLEYIHSLHTECDWLMKYFDVRKEARSSEIYSFIC